MNLSRRCLSQLLGNHIQRVVTVENSALSRRKLGRLMFLVAETEKILMPIVTAHFPQLCARLLRHPPRELGARPTPSAIYH